MRTFSARFGLLLLLAAGPASAQNQPSPPPVSTPAATAQAPAAAAPAPITTAPASAAAPATAAPAPAPAVATPSWRPFQELAFLVGSWSGSAESGARVGGRVARFTPEFAGNYLVHRGSTILTADDGAEETIEEVGTFTYDREKRRYVATYFFSTGISATFDVEVVPEGVRLTSREVLNAEAGTRMRMLFSRKGDGELALSMELAPGGKDFAPFLTSSLKKK